MLGELRVLLSALNSFINGTCLENPRDAVGCQECEGKGICQEISVLVERIETILKESESKC